LFKGIIIFSMLCVSLSFSQNLQFHYDFGKDRKYVTTTLEMFKPDEHGATFWFVDMDYDSQDESSMSLGYWEIARYISLPFSKNWSATIQYNDGAATFGPLGKAWFVGLSYPIDLKFITINTDILYANFQYSDSPDIQFTFVWYKPFFNNKINITGYADVWSYENSNDGKQMVIQAEPQIWYVLNKHFNIGGELEISKNFLPFDGWQMMPTLGFKWEF
jgi:hypothetical protein